MKARVAYGLILSAVLALSFAGCAPRRPAAPSAGVDPIAAREADRLYAQGVAAAREGAFARAAARFRGSLAADPARIETRYNLGLALLETGELVDATTLLTRVAEERPGHAETRYALGSALSRRRLHDQALAEFEAALRADHRHAKAAYAKARTLDDLGRRAEARDAWRDFLDRFPRDPRAAEARRRLAAPEPGPRAPGGR